MYLRILLFRTTPLRPRTHTSFPKRFLQMSKASLSSSSTTHSSSTTSIVWYKYNDLRIHDHEPLILAHNGTTSASSNPPSKTTHVIHVFVFDPFWFGTTKFYLPKMTYYKTKFLLESVADLRNQLQSKGCDLLIRTGSSADILPALAQLYNANVIYTHDEVCPEEINILRSVEKKLDRSTVTLQRIWGGTTMYSLDDLPFTINNLPDIYSQFRRKVEENCSLRTPYEISFIKQWKPFPSSESKTVSSSTSVLSSLSTIVNADPPVFPYAYNHIQGKGCNSGMGKIPSLEVLGAADLRPLYTALGIPNPSEKHIGIWTPGTEALNSDSGTSSTLNTSSSLSSSISSSSNQKTIPLFYESSTDITKLPVHTDTRTVLAFRGGETVALERLHHYLFGTNALQTYKETRNGLLGADYSSKFSPWLAFGCLSPRKIAAEVKRYERTVVANDSTYWMLFELLWRDYFRFYALKYGSAIFRMHGPRGLGPLGLTEYSMTNGSLNHRSNVGSTSTSDPSTGNSTKSGASKVWRMDNRLRTAWCFGTTGYPFVDANMRELLSTGFMSNRGRQNVASFLVKDLELDWRFGGEWFESLLLDHDPASNYGNWTYVAGVGADPREDRYFLIPKQARDYDPKGLYIRQWLPTLASVPTEGLLDPAKLSDAFRGNHYPAPIVQLLAHRRGFPSPKGNRKNNFKATGGGMTNTSVIPDTSNPVAPETLTSSSIVIPNGENTATGNEIKKKTNGNGNYSKKKHSRVQHF